MSRTLLSVLFALALSGQAFAQINPSGQPDATLPLNGIDEVMVDQGAGCAQRIQPCVTRRGPSTRFGQPVQQATVPTSPFAFQQWIDTSASPNTLKMYIGSTWFTVATLNTTTGYLLNLPASSVTGLGTMATQNATAVAITGGSITGMPTPTSNSDVATKSYVDGKASGVVFQQAVDYATAAVLPNTPTYANGTLGVGRTLTAGANSTLTVDGTVAVLTKRVLVKNQSDQTQNGCYSVTTAGSGAAPWVLTGCTDWDTSAEMQTGSYFIVTAGATNAATSWVLNTTGAVVVGSTPLAFVQSGASNIYTAGTGLTLGGAVFSITNTGVAAATYGSATQVAQIALNAQGQATTASNVSIAIPASQLTNGTTGSGAVMLAASPTTTGTLTAGAVSASGIIAGTAQANQFGTANGDKNSPTSANTNLLLYKNSTTNYAGFGAHTDGTIYAVTGTSSPATRFTISPNGSVGFTSYGAGALSTDGSGNIAAGTLSLANGGTAATTAAAAFANIAIAASSIGGNGYIKLQNGLYIQWGSFTLQGATDSTFNFPTAFPTALFAVNLTVALTPGSPRDYGVGTTSTSQFHVTSDAASSAPGYFIAIGN